MCTFIVLLNSVSLYEQLILIELLQNMTDLYSLVSIGVWSKIYNLHKNKYLVSSERFLLVVNTNKNMYI